MRLRCLIALAPLAVGFAACGGGDDGPKVSAADQAGCDSAYNHGGDAATGDARAVAALLTDLGDAGPDDDFSAEVSGRLQILAADALLLTSGGSAPNIATHVDDAYAACTDIGWEAPSN